MTYLWLCVSVWLVLNGIVIVEVAKAVRADRRDAKGLRAAVRQLEQDRVAERRRIFEARGGAR